MYSRAARVTSSARCAYCFTNDGIRPSKRRQYVVAHEHLPSQCGPAPMRWSAPRACRHLTRRIGAHGLDHDREHTGALERVCFFDQRLDVLALHRLAAITAHLMERLRLEPEVAHHRDPDLHHPPHRAHNRQPALDLHRGGARFSRRPALRTASSTLTW